MRILCVLSVLLCLLQLAFGSNIVAMTYDLEGTTNYLVTLDPKDGSIIKSVDWGNVALQCDSSAINTKSQQYFLLGNYVVYIINSVTAVPYTDVAQIVDSPLDIKFDDSTQRETLYGIIMDDNSSYVASINLNTSKSESIAEFDPTVSLIDGAQGFDSVNHRYYFTVQDNTSTSYVWGINVASKKLDVNIKTNGTVGQFQIDTANNRIIAVEFDTNVISTYDITTGKREVLLNELPGIPGLDATAYDPSTNLFYMTIYTKAGTNSLFIFDVVKKASQTVPVKHNFAQLQFQN